MKKACSRLTIRRESLLGHPEHVKLTAYAGRRIAGFLTLRNLLSVGFIDVHPSMQRCGVATKLYERAASIACKEGGSPLRSDTERTAYSQGFWDKQVRKGRATCVEQTPQTYPAGDSESVEGRGNCLYYKLKCPAPKSLAGVRLKRMASPRAQACVSREISKHCKKKRGRCRLPKDRKQAVAIAYSICRRKGLRSIPKRP